MALLLYLTAAYLDLFWGEWGWGGRGVPDAVLGFIQDTGLRKSTLIIFQCPEFGRQFLHCELLLPFIYVNIICSRFLYTMNGLGQLKNCE